MDSRLTIRPRPATAIESSMLYFVVYIVWQKMIDCVRRSSMTLYRLYLPLKAPSSYVDCDVLILDFCCSIHYDTRKCLLAATISTCSRVEMEREWRRANLSNMGLGKFPAFWVQDVPLRKVLPRFVSSANLNLTR